MCTALYQAKSGQSGRIAQKWAKQKEYKQTTNPKVSLFQSWLIFLDYCTLVQSLTHTVDMLQGMFYVELINFLL